METIFGELKDIKELKDQPLLLGYELSDSSKFYLEHTFITQLTNLFNIHKAKKQLIIDSIFESVKTNRNVIFVHDYEYPVIDIEGYIILEIEDITNPLHIFVEDKSRGSDYGD